MFYNPILQYDNFVLPVTFLNLYSYEISDTSTSTSTSVSSAIFLNSHNYETPSNAFSTSPVSNSGMFSHKNDIVISSLPKVMVGPGDDGPVVPPR